MVPHSVPESFSLETFLALKKDLCAFPINANCCGLLLVNQIKVCHHQGPFVGKVNGGFFSSSQFKALTKNSTLKNYWRFIRASSCLSSQTSLFILLTFFFCLHLIVLYNYPSIILDHVDSTMSSHSGRSPQLSMWEKTSLTLSLSPIPMTTWIDTSTFRFLMVRPSFVQNHVLLSMLQLIMYHLHSLQWDGGRGDHALVSW